MLKSQLLVKMAIFGIVGWIKGGVKVTSVAIKAKGQGQGHNIWGHIKVLNNIDIFPKYGLSQGNHGLGVDQLVQGPVWEGQQGILAQGRGQGRVRGYPIFEIVSSKASETIHWKSLFCHHLSLQNWPLNTEVNFCTFCFRTLYIIQKSQIFIKISLFM